MLKPKMREGSFEDNQSKNKNDCSKDSSTNLQTSNRHSILI